MICGRPAVKTLVSRDGEGAARAESIVGQTVRWINPAYRRAALADAPTWGWVLGVGVGGRGALIVICASLDDQRAFHAFAGRLVEVGSTIEGIRAGRGGGKE